jgi:hypothetical protein
MDLKEIRIMLRKMRKYIHGPKITELKAWELGGQRNTNNGVTKKKGELQYNGTVEDLTPRVFHFSLRIKFCPTGDSNSCPPHQE